MANPTIYFLVLITTVRCYDDGKLIFKSDDVFEIGDICVTVHNRVNVNGVCMPIGKCPLVWMNVLRQKFDHIVCGYDGKTQIVCCPTTKTRRSQQQQQVSKINLRKNLECRLENSNEIGIIKFLSDCPELKINNIDANVNLICDDEVCSDLVCCPVTALSRLKNVCLNVDHPIERLEVRLLQNQECTVKGLNIKGRYQLHCGYAERNPHLKAMLQTVCNDKICDNWYCCPIEDIDIFECTSNQISNEFATFVGPKCFNSKSGRKGRCKQAYYMHPDILTVDKCGSYCCSDFYCYPDDIDLVNQPISSRECRSYSKYLSKEEIEVPMDSYIDRTICPIKYNLLVAGGTITQPGEFPHMAALGYKPNEETLWHCGGSLISNRFILTAGHCLTDQTIGPVQKVRLGVIDLLNSVIQGDCPEDFDVAKIIPHPEYNPKFVYNDIGLVELAAEVKFNYHIRPICLPPNADVMQNYISMGWGATGNVFETSVKLIKVHQELFPYSECQRHYDVGRKYPKGIMNDTHICAGSRRSIKSTCPGDSGGPLIVYNSNRYSPLFLHGIVSFGTTCGFANSPGVYTKVFPYVKWIENTVWNVNYYS